MDFQARYILVKPPTPKALAERLKSIGKESASEEILKTLASDLDETKTAEVYNHTITNDDLDASSTSLSDVIFEKKGAADEDEDEDMDDAGNAEEEGGEEKSEDAQEQEMNDSIVVADP